MKLHNRQLTSGSEASAVKFNSSQWFKMYKQGDTEIRRLMLYCNAQAISNMLCIPLLRVSFGLHTNVSSMVRQIESMQEFIFVNDTTLNDILVM
jgi:hypothetical protein